MVLGFKKPGQFRKDVYQILGVTNSKEALRALKRMEVVEAEKDSSDLRVHPDGVGIYGHRPGKYMETF